MTRRDWFQIGCTLLGISFLVAGLANITRVVMYLRAFPNYEPFQNGILAEILLWLGVVVFVLSGILLIWRSKSWSFRLFPDDAIQTPAPTPRLSRADYFEVGLKLLGTSLLVLYVPNAILEAVQVVQDRSGTRDVRAFLAAVLAVGVSVVFVFQSRWVAIVVGLRDTEQAEPADNGAGDGSS